MKMYELIQRLSNKYQDVITLSEEKKIYKVIERYESTPIKTLYFDFSEDIPNSKMALDAYHQEHIMTSYYETTGSMQWNHYVYFIHDNEGYENSYQIQKNKDYARKTILDVEQFEVFLDDTHSLNNFYEEQTTPVEDLMGEWQDQLEHNNLRMVYDKTPVSRLTETLLIQEEETNIPSQEEPQAPVQEGTELETAFPVAADSFIKTVYLNQYRDYPKLIEQDVKNVNLIHGVNGSGKTSFLEAIEAVTCGGKTQRNWTTIEANANMLELGFETMRVNANHATAIYKNRDKKWYGSTNETRNKLFENFNRFNFYHAEAASDIESGTDINQIIKNIILGKDIAKLEKRIDQSKEEFARAKRSLDKQSSELAQQISSIREDIEKQTNVRAGLEATHIELNRLLNVLHWKKEFPDQTKASQEALVEISYLIMSMDTISKLSESSKVSDLSHVEKIHEDLEKDNTVLISTLKSIAKTNEQKKAFTQKISEISDKLSNVKKLSQWLNLDRIHELYGLEEKLEKLKKESYKFADIFQRETPYTPEPVYQDSDKNLYEYQAELTTAYEQNMKKKEEFSKELNELQEKVGVIGTFKSNLQEYATKLLSINNDKTRCPVCNTSFPEKELLEIVKDITTQIENVDTIKAIKKNIEDLDTALNYTSTEKSKIDEIVFLGKQLIAPENVVSYTVGATIQVIIDAQDRLNQLSIEINDFESVKKHFSSRGITQKELSDLTNAYEKKYAVEYGSLTQQALEIIIEKFIEELGSQEENLAVFDIKIATLEKEITRIKSAWNVFIDSKQDLLQYFSQLLADISQLKKTKQVFLTYIQPENLEVVYLMQTISFLSTNVQQFSALLIENEKQSLALESLERNVEDDERTLASVTENLEKLDHAIDILNALEPSRIRLNTFFINNTQSILDVFMMIHAPAEFDGLSFDDGIQLRREKTQEFESISKISTGQKSALALAIFLTMNRNAKDAPRYILFDDPVSNTDDINILAFFDFLRELSLSGKRQIFFATANSKIANLFRKKFDFLGGEFQDIRLSR